MHSSVHVGCTFANPVKPLDACLSSKGPFYILHVF